MNYGELKTAVIEDTHRPDLIGLVPRFIREGEGMIRRELNAYLLTDVLDDTDRLQPESAHYNLPAGVLIIRSVSLQGETGPEIERVALGSINILSSENRVAQYAEPGNGTVQFSGNPPAGQKITIIYYGMPAALVDDADTNDLLDENESMYKAAAMFYLYQNTQDRELASDALDVFSGIIATLNEQIARKIGGAKITASYKFGAGGGY